MDEDNNNFLIASIELFLYYVKICIDIGKLKNKEIMFK